MSQQPVLLTSSIPLVEEGLAHCNEASNRFDGDARLEQFNLKADDLQQDDKMTATTTNLPILDSNTTAPSPMSGSPVPSVHDSASIHSLPAVQVTEPQESPSLLLPPNVPPLSDDDGVSSVQRRIGSSPSTPLPSPRRSHISRSPVEGRSPNRISGFFSHLIHRRDHIPPSPSATVHHERTSNTPEGSVLPSRSSSLVPVPRPSTPPPSLPSPSLFELGLSLTVLTDYLSPSHFNSPPTSGTFLAPHYLLLCHAQGLDVLSLVSPPAPASYALIRRVSFKSVVVMEHRGVLVAISGRRDGVRVYALDEIKKAVEWRLDVEIRREREKLRRAAPGDLFSLEKMTTPRPNLDKNISVGRSPSAGAAFFSKGPQPKKAAKPQTPPQPLSPPPAINYIPAGPPPSYRSPSPPPQPVRQASVTSLRETGGRGTSVNDVLRGTISRRPEVVELDNNRNADVKSDWMEDSHSDDEAINVVAAGASGSQALDERTSAMMVAESSASNTSGLGGVPSHSSRPLSTATLTPAGFRRATRPADLDLSAIRAEPRPSMPPSPTPTLLTLRQALAAFPASAPVPAVPMSPRLINPPILDPDPDDDDENENGGGTPTNDSMSFAEALLESRIPDLPPPGTRLPQQAILLAQSHTVATGDEDTPNSPTPSGTQSNRVRQSSDTLGSRRPRRRWSVLDGIFSLPGGQSEPALSTNQPRDSQDPLIRGGRPTQRSRSPLRSSPTTNAHPQSSENTVNPSPALVLPHSRFLSRIISNAFSHRRSEDSVDSLQLRMENTDGNARKQLGLTPPHAPPPKLEYVKLPGTKGSLMIKAVETNKKSFLAILCGENGEKVELFAGTYRTALGLSRTFILPDSPRSLELQLQGDDLVEVFLVFSQNVFGLEPATVRVREVRLGRAERRAARRRARELQVDDLLGPEADAPPAVEDTTNVNVSVGFSIPSSVSVTTETAAGAALASGASPSTSQLNATQRTATGATSKVEDITPIPSGAYTTFQQLSFSPNFPLAAIVDEYVIPPTYPSFLQYRSVYEPEVNGNADVDLSQVQFSPPGLPVPPASPPSRWFYRDPKGVVHGPWTLSRMHAWYREALLPPDLPVRREEEVEFVLLKDLRQHCVDPSQPFGPASIRAIAGESPVGGSAYLGKPLLHPISLLSQSRLFGPPALFFSSRGGHSTAIVDGRGRSVLKDRLVWTSDEDADGQRLHSGRLGDIKRLEAFDLQDRSVLVAMRQGGFEAVDLTDALLRPADASRDVLPHFTAPPFQMNRRKIYTWRIGSPTSTSSSASASTTTLPRNFSRHNVSLRKPGIGPGRASARQEFGSGDFEGEHSRSEIIYLGRQDDNVYLCERDGDTFRVLRLSPLDAS